jgi:PAS domain S-box-containing protein
MKILIVDDKEENLYLLETLLKGNGYDVEVATNGAEALESIKAGGIELIISDILMPVMDGFQLCRKVKTDEALRHIPFIIYTATYTGPQDEAFVIKIGADRFIQKPCEPDIFLEAIQDVVKNSGERDSASMHDHVDEEEILKLYSERLVRKLEQKMLALEKEVQTRRELEETLRAGERKYRLLADNTLDVIWAMGINLVFTYVNPAIRNVTGYSPEEWIGSPLSEHCDEENFAKMVRVIDDEMAKGPGGSGVILEAELMNRNHDPIPFEIHGKVNYDEKGNPVGLQGIAREISERKRAERALREAYDIINKSSSVAFTWKNQEGWPVEFVSENVEGLFGYSAEEFMTGKINYAVCVHPDDFKRVVDEVAEFSREERTEFIHEPYRIIAKDGSERIVNDWTYIVRAHDGSITHYRGILEDITERKLAEKERKSLEQQLMQSQKLEAVATLTTGIAHDFNNLLSAIIGNAEMALMDLGKEEPLYEVMVEINEAAKRAASLTRQLLAFSRKQILQPEIFDLNNVIRGMDKILRRIIGEDVEIQTILSADLGRIETDVVQIEQILMNLIINAKDAMPTGGKITIETANVELDEVYAASHVAVVPGAYVMLAVSDTGCGMTKEDQARIFEPFYTSKKKGTGLGLSTVYGIVKQSNGNIWVYSEPGKGSAFKIYLPRMEKPGSGTKKAVKKRQSLRGSETILVVEDDEMVRNMVLSALRRYGYTVLMAADGQEALLISREHEGSIDLVLTDVVMPRMSGKEVAEEIETIRQEMKVLYMSGYTDNAIVHHGVLQEGVAFLQKPFPPESLLSKVREVLDN